RYRAIDEPWIDRQQGLVAQAQRREGAGPVILDQNVGALNEALQDLAARLLLQIEGDRALVRALGQKGGAAIAAVERPVGAALAALVGFIGVLDLDDVGAQHRQLIGGEWAGQHMGDVDDADALKGSGHDGLLAGRVKGSPNCPAAQPPNPRHSARNLWNRLGNRLVFCRSCCCRTAQRPIYSRVSIVAGERSKDGTSYRRRLRRQGS